MQGKEYKRKERKRKRKKKDERRVEPVSGGFVSSRLQSDKPLHHGPALSGVQHFIYLCFTCWLSKIERKRESPVSVILTVTIGFQGRRAMYLVCFL